MIPTLHDVDIVGIEYDRELKALSLKLSLLNGNRANLRMEDVFGWELSPFQDQNVIFKFMVYVKEDVNESVIDELDIYSGYVQWIMDESGILIHIHSSVGLNGYIVAKKVYYEDLQ
jgi:hypothetical protein